MDLTHTHSFDPLIERAHKTPHVSLSSMEIEPLILKDYVFGRGIRCGSTSKC